MLLNERPDNAFSDPDFSSGKKKGAAPKGCSDNLAGRGLEPLTSGL